MPRRYRNVYYSENKSKERGNENACVFFKVPHLLPAVGVGLYSPTLTHYTHKTVQLKSPGNYSVQQDVKFNFVSTMHSKLSQAHWN